MKITNMSVLAIMAVIAIALCSFIPAVNVSATDMSDSIVEQDGKQTYKYVSLGESMSIGYALTGYYPEDGTNQYGFLMDVEGSYPHKLTEYLKTELSEDYEVQHVQLGVSGARSVEIRALVDDDFTGMDDYPGDDQTKSYFSGSSLTAIANAARKAYPDIGMKYTDDDTGNFGLMKEVYRTELADADLITYNSHYDFAYDIAGYVVEIAQGGPGPNTDFTLYFEPEYIEMAKIVSSYVIDYFLDLLAEHGIDLTEHKSKVQVLAKAIAYAVVSYCANFDGIMAFIHSVNPDAKVLAIDSYNMFAPMEVTYSGVTVSASDLYDYILGVINPYVKYASPYALYCYHVDVDDAPMMLGNEFRDLERDQISDDAKSGLVRALGLIEKPADPQGTLYYDAIDTIGLGNLSKFFKYVFSSYQIDADLVISQDISVIQQQLIEKTTKAIELTASPLTQVTIDSEGSCTISLKYVDSVTYTKGELSLLWVYLYLMASDFVLSHPSPFGHSYIEECIEAEIVKDDILSKENRIYVTEDGPRSYDSSSDISYGIYSFTMKGARCAVTYVYKDWDDIAAYINSDDYDGFYLKIQGIYSKWQAYYHEGGLDEDLVWIQEKLIYLDDNWDTIFAGYTEIEVVKQLHLMVKDVCVNWDSYKTAIGRIAVIVDERFGMIVDFLEPESVRATIADKELSTKIRECLLYISLNWDAFACDVYNGVMAAETPEQIFYNFDEVLTDYQRPGHEAKFYEAVEPACLPGYKAHYECKLCSEYFIQDDHGNYVKVSAEELILPAKHSLIEHAAEAPGCETEGNNLYYTCENCDLVFKADKITLTTVAAETLAAKGHSCIEHAAVSPGCETEGNNLYYTCHDCDAVLKADMITHTTVADETLAAIGHAYHLHEAAEATCVKEGNNLYYTCDHDCGSVFKSDKVTRTTVQAETIAKTEHIHQTVPGVTPTKTESGWSESEICSYCKEILTEAKEIPATGTDDSKIESDGSKVSFVITDSDEMKALKVSLADKVSGLKSRLSVPESTIDSLKGKVLQFSVDRSATVSDTYEVSMTADGSAFNGEVYISLPYDASKGTPSVKWVDQDTPMEVVSIDSDAGLVTFKTTHNSTYQVTYSNEAASSSSDVWIYVLIAAIVIALLIIGVAVWKKKHSTQ